MGNGYVTPDTLLGQSKPPLGGGKFPTSSTAKPIVVAGKIIGYSVEGQFFTPEEIASLGATGAFPGEGGGGGGGGGGVPSPFLQPTNVPGVYMSSTGQILDMSVQELAGKLVPTEVPGIYAVQ